MKEQKIIWTVLPDGTGTTSSGATGLKFSVFISPRLFTDEGLPEPHLDQFPDFLNWPEKVESMEFDVELNNGTVIRTVPDHSDLENKLWMTLFKPTTYVRPYEFKDFKNRAIRSFPVQDAMSYIKKKYVTIAEKSPGSLPLIAPRRDDDGNIIDDADSTLESLIDDLGDLIKPEKKILCSMEQQYRKFKEVLTYGNTDAALKILLPYFQQCLKNNKLPYLSDQVRISKIENNTWKITDGVAVYYIEDTGEILNLFKYDSIYSKIDQVLGTSKVLDPNNLYGYKKEQLDFLQANRFYDRQEISNPYYFRPNARMAPAATEIPKIDFHQMLSTLGDHPELMRKMALVIDFVIPLPEEPFSEMRIIPLWNPEAPPSIFNKDLPNPWTKCIFTNNGFSAMPKPGSKLKNRMLNLNGASDEHSGSNAIYNLVQVDPDGASLQIIDSSSSISRQIKRRYVYTLPKEKSIDLITNCQFILKQFNSILEDLKGINYAEFALSGDAKISKIAPNKWIISDKGKTLELEHTGKETVHLYRKMEVAYDTPDDAGLPALRSAGIALTESRRAFKLNRHFISSEKANQDFEGGNPVSLYADDLVRGYRVDILDEDSDHPEWLSLCRRVGTYSFPGSVAPKIIVNEEENDEGYVKRGSTSSADAQDSDLYYHETVFRWNGWSLCAQRPGKTIVSEPYQQEVYLFCWDDVPGDNTKLLDFLESYLNARWVKQATVSKPDNQKITVSDPENLFTLVLEADDSVNLTTGTGQVFEYISKKEDGKTKVYTIIDRQDETPGVLKNKAVTEFKLESEFIAQPGSLPRLRFGHTYRLRARIVDLAGNSESWNNPDGSLASESIHYVRYEPLLPPTLVPRAYFTEGESVERMVIRSNFDLPASEYVDKEEVKNILQDGYPKYQEGNERHIAPPKTSQLMAETHGEFDQYIGKEKDHKTGYYIALKEEGTLFDETIVDTATGEKTILVDPKPIIVTIIKEEEGESQYVIHREEKLLLPYLPDPIARGASFHNLPGLSSSGTPGLDKVIVPGLGLNILKVPFELKWPDALPFRIRILERPGHMKDDSCEETFDTEDPPEWDPNNNILTVFIAKAEESRVRYNCYFSNDDLSSMGIWRWLENSSSRNKLAMHALAGGHWMFTPWRELVMVHAVQQPLCEPKISFLQSIKSKIGDTFTSVEGELRLNSKSTGKVELLAGWTEPVDDLAMDVPGTMDVNASAFELKPGATEDNTIYLPVRPCVDHRHEFGDTKYRHVKYYLVGTTRFREYFHTSLTEDQKSCFDWDKIPGDDSEKLVDFLNERRQTGYTSAATITKITVDIVTVEEGGITTTLTRNHDKNALVVTLDGKDYIYPVISEGNQEICLKKDRITRRGPVFEAYVLNSARPASPKVQVMLPTFGWEEKREPQRESRWKVFERKRIGGGLRVYLERPWYSSGDGELLGVVLYPHAMPDKYKPVVTQWGMDPIRKSKVPKGILGINDFTGVEKSQVNLSLEEIGESMQKFDVVGYKPEYNADRKLWSCDIQFEPAKVISYYPFVRLALACYQPNSITHAHLSRVVLTDFMQLANDRTLRIEFNNERDFYVSLTGYGTGDRSSNRVEATIEELPAGAHEEFGWIPIPGLKTQPNPCTLPLKPIDFNTYLWRWEANLKLPARRKARKFRLVVREFEKYEADKEVKLLAITHVVPAHYATQEVERLVYADIVEL